jgi:hypothetical protein
MGIANWLNSVELSGGPVGGPSQNLPMTAGSEAELEIAETSVHNMLAIKELRFAVWVNVFCVAVLPFAASCGLPPSSSLSTDLVGESFQPKSFQLTLRNVWQTAFPGTRGSGVHAEVMASF